MDRYSIYPTQLINDRINLPEPAIKILGRRPILGRAFEQCINIFTPKQWQENIAILNQLDMYDTSARNFIRAYTRGATESVVYGKSIKIPEEFIKYGELSGGLLLVAAKGGFQLYSKSTYLKTNGITASSLALSEKENRQTDNAIYLGEPLYIPDAPKIILSTINTSLIDIVKKDNALLYQISSREFEQLVADMLSAQGYDVTLTKATCDGGVDIYAAINGILGSFLYLVECKQYSADRNVGVSAIRQLYGNVEMKKANAGVLITTSRFSKPAIEFQQQVKHRISLHDHDILIEWLKKL